MRRIVRAVLFLLIALPTAALAQPPWIGVFPEQSPNWHCGVAYNGPGVVQMHVFVYGFGMTGTGFTAPIPACLGGAVYLSDEHVFSLSMGNSQTGVALIFEDCMTVGWVHVLTINVYVEDLTENCCPYRFLPYPGSIVGGPEVMDCNDNILVARDPRSFVSEGGGMAPPFVEKPQPPDGATEQPVDIELSWSVYLCSCALGVYWDDVYFGTNPNPPRVAEQLGEHAYDPGPLEPQTTYYWKVRAYDSDGGATVSPVWTFTTGNALPVEPTTWGRIKGLYLE